MKVKCSICGKKGKMTNDWAFALFPKIRRFCPKCADTNAKKETEQKKKKWRGFKIKEESED